MTPPPAREELPEGRDLVGVGLGDDALTVRVAGVNHRTLVACLSGTCLTCQRFWDAFRTPRKLGLAEDIRLVICTKDPAEESAARIADLAPRQVPLVMASDARASYDVPGSPYFVLVDGDGAVQGEGTGIDWNQVRGLLTQVGDDADYAAELGAAAPASPTPTISASVGSTTSSSPQGSRRATPACSTRLTEDPGVTASPIPPSQRRPRPPPSAVGASAASSQSSPSEQLTNCPSGSFVRRMRIVGTPPRRMTHRCCSLSTSGGTPLVAHDCPQTRRPDPRRRARPTARRTAARDQPRRRR